MITQEQLKIIADYCPLTGIFRRRIDAGKNQSGAEFARWKSGDVMGGINPQGYRRISIGGMTYQAHRLAWLYQFGEWPENQIDHVNGDRDDNRICNLRQASNTDNGRNAKRMVRNRTGITGVHIHTQNGSYIAQIKDGGKILHIGCFDNLLDAACARKSAEQRYGYHPNHGRAPLRTS